MPHRHPETTVGLAILIIDEDDSCTLETAQTPMDLTEQDENPKFKVYMERCSRCAARQGAAEFLLLKGVQ